jgi:hypothetical protein
VEPRQTLAFGLDLCLTTEYEGGRRTAIGGVEQPVGHFQYRPDWALPLADGGLSAGPVVGFSKPTVAPGDRVRAVIVALVPHSLPWWEQVEPGAVLPMHEGPRVCGYGTVVWRRSVSLPLTEADTSLVQTWLADKQS